MSQPVAEGGDVLLFFDEHMYGDCAVQYFTLIAYCRAKHEPAAKDVIVKRYATSGRAAYERRKNTDFFTTEEHE